MLRVGGRLRAVETRFVRRLRVRADGCDCECCCDYELLHGDPRGVISLRRVLFPPSRKSRDFLRTPSRNALKVLPASESNEVSPFNFEGRNKGTQNDDDGEPWFVAADVARTLGYANPHEAVRTRCRGVRETLTPSKGVTFRDTLP
ncbi:BRO family protein [Paraburkholderia nemoris]|uniref:BRO family protein n=1 Tax=Paraburkholderia nemoris TaxID=2793076 RepID=UPI0038BDD442